MHDVSNEKRYECDVDDNMINDLKEVSFNSYLIIGGGGGGSREAYH